MFRGFPQTADLTADLKSGTVCEISIYSLSGGSRDTSRYSRAWQQLSFSASTIQAIAAGNVLTLSGAATAGQAVGLAAGGIGFAHAVTASDTPGTIAAALAASITSDGRLVATASGTSVTVTTALGDALPVTGVTSGSATSQQELRRQEQRVMVSFWCPTPQLRDQLAGAVDAALAAVDWLTLADGTQGRIRYVGTAESDVSSQATLYRRDINFVVEYPTTANMVSPTLMFPIGTILVSGVFTSFGPRPPIAGVLSPDGGASVEIDAGGNILVQTNP